jgi:hypothetical protein
LFSFLWQPTDAVEKKAKETDRLLTQSLWFVSVDRFVTNPKTNIFKALSLLRCLILTSHTLTKIPTPRNTQKPSSHTFLTYSTRQIAGT